jgi:hypothetical protein
MAKRLKGARVETFPCHGMPAITGVILSKSGKYYTIKVDEKCKVDADGEDIIEALRIEFDVLSYL